MRSFVCRSLTVAQAGRLADSQRSRLPAASGTCSHLLCQLELCLCLCLPLLVSPCKFRENRQILQSFAISVKVRRQAGFIIALATATERATIGEA